MARQRFEDPKEARRIQRRANRGRGPGDPKLAIGGGGGGRGRQGRTGTRKTTGPGGRDRVQALQQRFLKRKGAANVGELSGRQQGRLDKRLKGRFGIQKAVLPKGGNQSRQGRGGGRGARLNQIPKRQRARVR